jgi:hypothetical protein
MNTYYLQEGLPDHADAWNYEPRLFLDDRLHPGCKEISQYEARTWLEAREMIEDGI